jgi:hypothetical protein
MRATGRLLALRVSLRVHRLPSGKTVLVDCQAGACALPAMDVRSKWLRSVEVELHHNKENNKTSQLITSLLRTPYFTLIFAEMPPAKATRKTSTTVASNQPNLKASFAAVRNARSAVTGVSTEKKNGRTVAPIVTSVVATPPVEVAAPKPASKKVLKKRNSTTDEDSEQEDDYEPISPTLESDLDGQHVVDEVEVKSSVADGQSRVY